MNPYTYPRPMDIEVFIRWYNGGDSLFLGAERKQTLQSMKDLVERMGLPPEYESMRLEVVGASRESVKGIRFGYGPSKQFRREVADAMRLCGYVYYVAPGAPLMSRVPLMPHQIHFLRLLTRGHSTREIAEIFLTGRENIRWRQTGLRRSVGAATTGHAIALAYQRRWLPVHEEERQLSHRGAPMVPGCVARSPQRAAA